MAAIDASIAEDQAADGPVRLVRAERDIVSLGIAVTAIIMFVGTGGTVVPQVVSALAGRGAGPDKLLANALLLNIALVIFGWRRYRELAAEVVERRRAEEQARLLAETDPLTGCLNRRSVGAAMQRLVETARVRGDGVAFVMLDLDNFKQVNDVNGHAGGDEVLRITAERLGAAVPAGSVVARLGGDEFACVISFDPTWPDRVDQFVATLIDMTAQPIVHGSATIEANISVGVTSWRDGDPEGDPQRLLHLADIAMYHAKRHGRNRYFWFEPAMERELRFRSDLETGIRAGLRKGEFVPYYEKQIDLETGKLVGFEMLARWQSPKLGVVKPEIFIPIAEDIGVIAELSEGLIAQALEDAKHWDARLTLSVNISPVQLRDPWFAQRLLKLLVAANFPPARLDIEITETCLHEDLGVVRSLITSLKNQGVKISLDDFGTGYSSLAQLRTLPFDRIKIDRSFVTSLPENKDSEAIIQAITSLGEGLGLPIVAEGIESEDVLERLRKLGKFRGQGYLYGRPQPAARTREDLAELDLLLGPGLQALIEPAMPATDELGPAEERRAGTG
ncbi:putative bifunctional diguanylate cyclase/phosphodiesterase [Parablastomonas sp. CN1-191]|uniref:putative bifunctional diguanylate cyclase/phosphodiesterase n=1 Tax=Parablastomonas sp. CN1-191 TaxID=3400908 RepID=UPI003BF9226B